MEKEQSTSQDLIFCQRDIPKEKWRYGFRSSAATGCGWIATHNALCLMGYRPSPEKLIRYYERQLPLIHGNTGTTILAPAIYFLQRGFKVTCTANRRRFDEVARESDACVLYFWWSRKWAAGAHFVALHHTERGFVGYNTYRNSKGEDFYGESLDAFLKRKKYFAAVLIGVRDKR